MSDREAIDRIVDGKAWDDFCDRLKSAGRRILKDAPDDPFDRAEGLRYLGRLTSSFLRNATAEPEPATVSLASPSLKIGLDNPDYVYCGAKLDARFEYTLRGNLGDTHLIGFGTYSGALGTDEGLIRDGYLESGDLACDADGGFEIALSQTKQPGNWIPMAEKTNALQIRQTLLERVIQRPAFMELTRHGDVLAAEPLDPARFTGALDRTGGLIEGTVNQFLNWTAHFASHRFEIRPLPPELLAFAQGDPNTSYNYSYWELEEDEAYVIEFEPPECEYWNLQIGNHWLESLDFLHYPTHVNHHTAVKNEDGSVRVVVARRDPGVPNWLDTASHARGALALRWVGAVKIPTTRTRVVLLSELSGLK